MINILLKHYLTGVRIQIITICQPTIIIIFKFRYDIIGIGNGNNSLQRDIFIGGNPRITGKSLTKRVYLIPYLFSRYGK